MKFELDKEFLDLVKEAALTGNDEVIRKQMSDLHPSDSAEVIERLDFEEASYVFRLLAPQDSAEILAELDDELRIKLFATLTPKEIAQPFIEEMPSDDAADIINDLPDKLKDDVIANIRDREHAHRVMGLLHYPKSSAGGLMAKELICANVNWNIEQCIREVRHQAEDVKTFYTVYVVNDEGKLLGILSLKKLLFAQSATLVKDIYFKDVISVNTLTTSDEVSNLMKKYNIVSLPVVDALGKLLGRITIDDVVDVIHQEAEKDIHMMSGISESVGVSDKVWVLSRARLPWLLIGLLGGVISALVIGKHENALKIYPEMAFFIPLIGAMGGNAGVQSATIVVQGLANKTLVLGGMAGKLFKEFLVSLLNGLICAIVIFGYNFFITDTQYLGLTVSISLLMVIIFASLFGTFVPLMLDKMKIDPALATGPFVTTVNDIIGLTLYFIVGRMMYAG